MAQEQCNIRKKSKQYRRRHGRRMPKNLEVVNPDAAGIDLGSAIHYVSVPDDRCEEPIRHFGCYTPDLQAMAKWLLECGVTTVVMESTGVYWTPVFRVLEQQGFEVLLVNPKHVKYVPGRKTDVADCQWLRQLHTFGLLKGAFVPPNEVAEMRALWRHRKNLVEHKSKTILQVQKVFTQMNIQLHVVLSDISGVSGMKIIRAILRGERDPNVLVGLVNKQVKTTREEFVAALSGHYSDSQLFILGQLMAQYDSLQQQIQECDAQTEAYLSQFESKADVNSLGPHPKKRTSRVLICAPNCSV